MQPDRRTTWEKRLPTTRLADALPPGELMAESDLWASLPEEDPFGPEWESAPGWDGLDEVSPVHGETPEDPDGHSDTPERFREFRSEARELWDAIRARVAAAHCDCPTPWDTDPPSLLWAAGPKATAPERTSPLSAKPGADARAEADTMIELAGARRLKPWKEARHALLPPLDAKTKTRACWTAPLADGRVAVIDLPPEPRTGGVHCGDCHNSFGNVGAYQMHRPRRRDGRCRCVEPGSVVLVGRDMLALAPAHGGGNPLLKRTIGGVWSVDPLAVWGPEGPPLTPEQASTIYWDAQRALQARPWQFGKGHNRTPA